MTSFFKTHRQAFLIGIVGCMAAALKLQVLDNSGLGAGFEAVNVARSIVDGTGFSNPYSALATGPTAHTSPVFPYLMATLIKLLGFGTAFAVAILVLNFATHGLQAALLPAVSQSLLGDRRPGLYAAGLLILLPLVPITPQGETDLQIVVLMLCTLIPVAASWAIPAGLLGAFALHINPSSIFLLAGWLLWKRPGLRWTSMWGTALLLASLPWALRNCSVLGHPAFIRDNLALELYVSNNDLAQPSIFENGASLKAFHPTYSQAEAREVLSSGEALYMSHRGHTAAQWIRANPRRFLQLTLARFRQYWFPQGDARPWHGWLLSLVTLLSLPALPRVWRHPVFASAFLLAPLMYYFLQADLRYRLPFFWLTLLSAGLVLTALAPRLFRHNPN